MDNLLTPQQLSELLHIKLATVYKWVHYGYVPHVKLGSLVRFNEKRIENWLRKKERRGRKSYKISMQ